MKFTHGFKRENFCPNCKWEIPKATEFKNPKNHPFECPECSLKLRHFSTFEPLNPIIVVGAMFAFIPFVRFLQTREHAWVTILCLTPLFLIILVGFLTLPWTDKLEAWKDDEEPLPQSQARR